MMKKLFVLVPACLLFMSAAFRCAGLPKHAATEQQQSSGCTMKAKSLRSLN